MPVSLSEPVIIEGIIETGAKRGRLLGWPTINQSAAQLNVSDGIYLSHVSVANINYDALTFIGKPTTFDDHHRRIESYLFGFDRQAYGEYAKVTLLAKLRDNQHFNSTEALLAQMAEDKNTALAYFGKTKE